MIKYLCAHMQAHRVSRQRIARHAARLQGRGSWPFNFHMQKSAPTKIISSKRRPRTKPTPSGKRTTITDNDVFGIFEPLSRYAQLTTKQLVAFDQRCASKTRNRLTDLYHEQEGRWLERFSERMPFADRLFVNEIYRLGRDAEALLVARGILPADDWARASRIGGLSAMPSKLLRLAHDHMASDILIDIEIGARAAGQNFRSHIDIIKAAPRRTQGFQNPLRIPVPPIFGAPLWIEPDALFAIGERAYALETDRGSESVEAIIKGKIRAYREIVASYVIDDHWGIDNLSVLFVTLSEKRLRNMIRAVASIANNGRSKMFLFACRPNLDDFARAPAPDGRMFREGWRRVGLEDWRFE